MVCRAALWGLGIALFGYSSSLGLVFVGLAIGGGADAISGIFRTTMWNESIPPEMRGRMAGIEMISYSLGPTAGQFRAGVMAAWTTLRFSLTFGGLACTGSVATVALALPRLWSFDARSDPHVAEVDRKSVVQGKSVDLGAAAFSSTRRHTRCLSDWSSDVCSADLAPVRSPPSRSRCPGCGVSMLEATRTSPRYARCDQARTIRGPNDTSSTSTLPRCG